MATARPETAAVLLRPALPVAAALVRLRPATPPRRAPNPTRERLLRSGASALTEAELVELVLGGSHKRHADAERAILNAGGLKPLLRQDAHELARVSHLGAGGAAALLAAVELGRRYLRTTELRPRLSTPEAVYQYLLPKLGGLSREVFVVLSFDNRNTLLDDTRVAEGTQVNCPVDPGEVFRAALRSRATAVVLAHGHPSGDATPSANDVALTRQLHAGGKLLGIRVLDHLVLGDGCYVSMQQRGDIPFD